MTRPAAFLRAFTTSNSAVARLHSFSFLNIASRQAASPPRSPATFSPHARPWPRLYRNVVAAFTRQFRLTMTFAPFPCRAAHRRAASFRRFAHTYRWAGSTSCRPAWPAWRISSEGLRAQRRVSGFASASIFPATGNDGRIGRFITKLHLMPAHDGFFIRSGMSLLYNSHVVVACRFLIVRPTRRSCCCGGHKTTRPRRLAIYTAFASVATRQRFAAVRYR